MFTVTGKRSLAICLGLMMAALCGRGSCSACSVFCLQGETGHVIGRNYDWYFGEGMVVVNKRHQSKTAFVYWGEDRNNLAKWTSKYGSVTFVQYGREIAFDGMNEAGLVVSELWLEDAAYPTPDARPSMSVDQYVQYILDNFSSVDEIAASDKLIRLRPTANNFTKIHFFAVDATGASIVVEFIGGKVICHAKAAMPVQAITNDTYERSLAYFDLVRANPPAPHSSLAAFACIASMLQSYRPAAEGLVPYAFRILDTVKQANFTRFQIVFDVQNRIIYFKSLVSPQVRFIRFDAFDFSCKTPAKVLDINIMRAGDVTDQFIDYTTQLNEDLIAKAWRNLGGQIYPPALDLMARYPETFVCDD